jgi:hypothetical protein
MHVAIKKLKPYKAPGPDGISNSVYTHCTDLLVHRLGVLFRAMFKLHYYLDQWKVYNTMVIQKPGKPDYMLAKAHRPVMLCKTTLKILSPCIREVITHFTEDLNLLPASHFGCQPGHTATDSLHYLVKWMRLTSQRYGGLSTIFRHPGSLSKHSHPPSGSQHEVDGSPIEGLTV